MPMNMREIAPPRRVDAEIASRTSDPDFYSAMGWLPNPDPILRKLGKAQEVYDDILSDPHVIAEVRAMRSGILSFERRLQAGGDSPADMRALELCERWMQSPPSQYTSWADLTWSIAQFVLRGFSPHEVVWANFGQYRLPTKIIDRPQRRIIFGDDNEPRLRTRAQPIRGEELEPMRWLITRHMPTFDNPYGQALLSSCYWPYTFKHGGGRWWAKFCERHGLPWPIGKVPPGTSQDDQDDLAEKLVQMLEDAVAVIPDNAAVELLESSHTGTDNFSGYMDYWNREISKALRSQTLATEIQGQGSRAAAETHRGREAAGDESDRERVAEAYDTLLAWITTLNVPGANPPVFEFYEEEEARQDWADVLETARHYLSIPASFAHERLQIPMPDATDEVLPSAAGAAQPTSSFAAPDEPAIVGRGLDGLIQPAVDLADAEIERMIEQIQAAAGKASSLTEFSSGLPELVIGLDETPLAAATEKSITVAAGEGAADV